MSQLKSYEQTLAAFTAGGLEGYKGFQSLEGERKRLTAPLYGTDSSYQELRDHPKSRALKARLDADDAKLVAFAGSKAAEIWGDGSRATTISKDGEKAFDEFRQCPTTQGNGTPEIQRRQCDKALVRLNKIDPTAVRYRSGIDDNLLEAILLYVEFARSDQERADTYARPENKLETYIGCGVTPFTLQALKVGGNKYGPWERRSNGITEAVNCKKLAKSNKAPADVVAAMKREMDGSPIARLNRYVLDGRITFLKEDLPSTSVYKIANVDIHNPKEQLPKNPCGEVGETLVCEASGSQTAGFLNRIAFYLKRAAFYKTKKNGEKCKALTAEARKEAQELERFYDEAIKSKDWAPGLTYILAGGEKVSDKAIRARIPVSIKDAEDKSLPTWCDGD